MSDIQDGSPSSSEPVVSNQPVDQQGGAGGAGNDAGGASLGEQSPGATSAPVAPVSISIADAGPVPQDPIDATSTVQQAIDTAGNGAAAAVGQLSEGNASGAAADLGNAGAGPAGSGDAGEPLAEGQKDSGTLSPSNSTVAPASGDDAGNDAGQADSASGAISTGDAPLSPVTALAVATFADLMDKVETREYENGVVLKSAGVLPTDSPVSYPAPQAPEADSVHGLLNAIEEYFTTALRSSRTDGHKMIAQLRAKLSEQQ